MVHLLDLPVPHSGASRQVGLVPIEPCLVRPILIASPFQDVIIWSGYTLPSVGTRELRWSACLRADPPAGVAGRSAQAGRCGTTGAQSRRIAARDWRDGRGLIWFVWFIWFVSFVCLNQTNRINQKSQMNQKRGLS